MSRSEQIRQKAAKADRQWDHWLWEVVYPIYIPLSSNTTKNFARQKFIRFLTRRSLSAGLKSQNLLIAVESHCFCIIEQIKGIAKLYVTENVGNEHKFYLTKIEMESSDSMGQGKSGDPKSSNDSEISIAGIYAFVKKNNHRFEASSDHPTKFNPKPVYPAFWNEDGTPKKFYHGAKKNGGFTKFLNWQYFTGSKKHAERYAERDNPKALYEIYLTADKIFDTRDSKACAKFWKRQTKVTRNLASNTKK